MKRAIRGLEHLTRRAFVKGAAGAGAALTFVPQLFSETVGLDRAIAATAGVDDWWLGSDLWANRLQDWAIRNGRVTCVASVERRLRTASVSTRSLTGGPAVLRVRTGTQQPGTGFSGFLIGTGEHGTDYRRAALVLSASGTGGGLLCVYGSDGKVRFRRHTHETQQLAFPVISAVMSGSGPARSVSEDVELSLYIAPEISGAVTLTLKAVNAVSRVTLSQAVLRGVAPSAVTGGLALVSDGTPRTGATYWFAELQTSGAGVEGHPERSLGPIVGTLFTLTGSTLKMTAQLMPMVLHADDNVVLEVPDEATGAWVERSSAVVGPGFVALLRADDWDSSLAWDYRVRFSRGGSFDGRVPAEPSGGKLTIATLCCTKASHRLLDRASSGAPKLPGEEHLGLYTSRNLWFPHEQLASGIAANRPDLLVALGDQLYEASPTVKDAGKAPELDFLYKYILWLWPFRDLTRQIPCIVAVDDHDVYHGSLYGEGGIAVPPGSPTTVGGYVNAPDWVNIVQRVQCGHNPDPVDPTPVAQGISVYFTRFNYGGVRFVLLEGRKFKTGADGKDANGNPIPPSALVLLGPRQEALLSALAEETSSAPAVVLTQTLFGGLATRSDGTPSPSREPNGWPPLARTRALQLIKSAGAVILSGDRHLASLVRHNVSDGPVEFSVPAGSSSSQRWFQPRTILPNGTGQPFTGDFTDAFGNRMRVLAVKNMRFSEAEVIAAYGSPSYGHRNNKEEGYGILRVDLADRVHVFEAWRWDVDPSAPDARPMEGWPYLLSFDDV